ncbi:MAG: hypothetical protein CME70_18075 [Halobacteriovorax sp.]|nr:hypothetical protein [Halobacteriovorax sp.]
MSYFLLGLLVLLAIPTIVGVALVTLSAIWIRNLSRKRKLDDGTISWVDYTYPDKDCVVRNWCKEHAPQFLNASYHFTPRDFNRVMDVELKSKEKN